jgi:hypothetical protein
VAIATTASIAQTAMTPGEAGEDRGDDEQRHGDPHRAQDHVPLVVATLLESTFALAAALSQPPLDSLDEGIDQGRLHFCAELLARFDGGFQLLLGDDVGHAWIVRSLRYPRKGSATTCRP